MKSLCRGSAVIAATLLASSFFLSATPSVAETPLYPSQPQKQVFVQSVKPETKVATDLADNKIAGGPSATSQSGMVSAVIIATTDPAGGLAPSADSPSLPISAPVNYMATAYSLMGRTASGRRVAKGLIAADPTWLPLGTRVRLEAGSYSGEYLVADTGGAVRGKKIDIWTPSTHEACRFGRRTVKLTVLSYGPRRKALRRQRSR